MIYSNVPNPPSKFTATMWGKTVTIELDHSDIDLNELMDIFKGLTIASGFEMTSWNNVIKDTASEIYNEEHEIVKEALDTTDDDECNECDDNDFFGSWGSVEEEEPISQLQYNLNRDAMAEEESKSNEYNENEPKPHYDWDEEITNERIDIIGQNGNEGTHYDEEEIVWGDEDELETPTDEYKGIYSSRPTYDWDNETNDILTNINDSITIIKDRMEDIDMRMDNIDEQLDILNADVANIELDIAFPPPNEHILKAKDLYDRAVKAHNIDKEFYKDVVDMESGEVSVDGGFDGKGFKTPKVLGKWQTDNKTKEVVKLDKTKVRKGKIKDLKK